MLLRISVATYSLRGRATCVDSIKTPRDARSYLTDANGMEARAPIPTVSKS